VCSAPVRPTVKTMKPSSGESKVNASSKFALTSLKGTAPPARTAKLVSACSWRDPIPATVRLEVPICDDEVALAGHSEGQPS